MAPALRMPASIVLDTALLAIATPIASEPPIAVTPNASEAPIEIALM